MNPKIRKIQELLEMINDRTAFYTSYDYCGGSFSSLAFYIRPTKKTILGAIYSGRVIVNGNIATIEESIASMIADLTCFLNSIRVERFKVKGKGGENIYQDRDEAEGFLKQVHVFDPSATLKVVAVDMATMPNGEIIYSGEI